VEEEEDALGLLRLLPYDLYLAQQAIQGLQQAQMQQVSLQLLLAPDTAPVIGAAAGAISAAMPPKD
jgi:hypothetical protein